MTDPTYRLGDKSYRVLDPGVPTTHHDIVVEHRIFGGTVCIGLASVTGYGETEPTLNVVARLRMTLPAAVVLRDTLNDLISLATTPAATEEERQAMN